MLLSPVRTLRECFEGEKIAFFFLTMGPLLFLPLCTRRYERLVLLIPFLLVNLMSDYTYQHSIFFQYTYGSAACLFYLTAVNLAELPPGAGGHGGPAGGRVLLREHSAAL